MTGAAGGAFGAYGKLPALGDFFRIALGPGFIDPWDRFAQQALTAGRAALGARWNDCYLTAPIWRFTLSGGLAGPDPAIGVMMSSIDRVGRQFPLVLAAPLPGGTSALLDHFLAAPVHSLLEGIALEALEDTMTRDLLARRLAPIEARPARFGARIARAPSAAVSAMADGPGGGTGGGAGGAGALVAVGAGGQGLLADLAAHLGGAGYDRPSVWSADVTGGMRLMICEGLPGPAEVPGLFDLDAPVWHGRATPPAAPPSVPGPEDAPAEAPPPPVPPGSLPDGERVPERPPDTDPGTDILAEIIADPGGDADPLVPDPEAGADLLADLLADPDGPEDGAGGADGADGSGDDPPGGRHDDGARKDPRP